MSVRTFDTWEVRERMQAGRVHLDLRDRVQVEASTYQLAARARLERLGLATRDGALFVVAVLEKDDPLNKGTRVTSVRVTLRPVYAYSTPEALERLNGKLLDIQDRGDTPRD